MASPLDDVEQYQQEPDTAPPSQLDNAEQRLTDELPNTNRYAHRQIVDQLRGIRVEREIEGRKARAQATATRLKARDLADRGIPTFREANGVAPVTDEAGAPLTNYDKAHRIAYDSAGNARSVDYGPTGPPALNDPFANSQVETDEKTGDQYQKRAGLPWKWVGADEGIKAERMQTEKDKAVKQEAALLGQKISIQHANLVAGDKEHEIMKKELANEVPTLQDPNLAGADREAILGAIDNHFNSEYARPEANATNGWFSKDLSPAAQKLRGDIDARKEGAMQKANRLFDIKDEQNQLGSQIDENRRARENEIDTLIAHGRGQTGPLDSQMGGRTAPGGIHTPDGTPYPVTRDGNIDTNIPGGSVDDALRQLSPGPGWSYNGSSGQWQPPGMLEHGNIDVNKQPVVQNEDGSVSTVRSFSIGIGGKEVLLPTVSPDGGNMTKSQAVQRYMQTGQHLGVFSSPDAANAYAEGLHQSEASRVAQLKSLTTPADLGTDPVTHVTNAIASGSLPDEVSPAALAAAHDAHDANAKAEALKDSNPGLAQQFKAVAQGILHGLATGVADIVKGAPGILKATPLGTLTAPFHKFLDEQYSKAGAAIQGAADSDYDKALAGTVGGKIGNFVGGALPFVATSLIPGGQVALASKLAVHIPTVMALFSAGYGATKEDALKYGADPDTAEKLANASGSVNAILALPFKGVGGAISRVFGGKSAPVIKEAIESAFQREGPEGAAKLIDGLRGYVERNEKPVIGNVAQDVRAQVVAAIDSIKGEILKTPAQRAATLAKHMASAGALGAGVRTTQNIIGQQYDPERGTFEGVPEAALGFALLAGVSHGFDQVVAARRAKQALDLLRPGEEGPPAVQGPTQPPPNGPAPAGPKQARGRTVEPIEGEPNVSETSSTSQPARPQGSPREPIVPNATGATGTTRALTEGSNEPAAGATGKTPATAEAGGSKESAKPNAVSGSLEGEQPAGNGRFAHAKVFGDSASAQTLSNQNFEALPRNGQSVVLAKVRAALDDPQVLRVVIQSVPVDVVHGLIGSKIAPEQLLHDKSVLTHRLSVSGDVPIPQTVSRFVNSLSTALKGGFVGGTTEKTGLAGTPSAVDESAPAKTTGGTQGAISHTEVSPTGTGKQAGNAGTVDTAAHEAATSPHNDLAQPTSAQQREGNYQKGHIVQLGGAGGINVAIENPQGSQRSNLDTAKLGDLARRVASETQLSDALGPAVTEARHGNYQAALAITKQVSSQLKVAGHYDLADSVHAIATKAYAQPMESHYGYVKGTVGADKDHIDVFIKPGTPTNYSGPVYVVDQTTTAGKETFDEHKAIVGANSHEEALAEYRKNYDADHQNNYSGVTEFKNVQEFKKWAESGVKGPAAKSKGVAPAAPSRPVTGVPLAGDVKSAETQLWRLTSKDSPQLLNTLRKQYGDHPDYLDVLNEHIQKHAGKAEATSGEHGVGDKITIDNQNWKVTGVEGGNTKLQRAGDYHQGGQVATQTLNTNFIRNQIASGHFTLEPASKVGQVPAREETAPSESAGSSGQEVAGKPQRQQSDVRNRPRISTPEAAKSAVEAATREHAADLKKSGTQVTSGPTKTESGFQTNADGDITVDHAKLVGHAEHIWERGGHPADWIKDAIGEEGFHSRQVKVAGNNFTKIYSAIHKQLPAEARAVLEKVYPDDKTSASQAAEYVRMLWQHRTGKKITEAHFRNISGLLPHLIGKQPTLVEQELKRVMDYSAPTTEAAPTKDFVKATEQSIGGPLPDTATIKERRSQRDRLATLKRGAGEQIPAKDSLVITSLLAKDTPTVSQLNQALRLLQKHGAITEGGENAVKPGNAQVEGGTTPVGGKEGAGSQKPASSGGDHVVGETQGTGKRGKISGTEKETEPAGGRSGVPTVAVPDGVAKALKDLADSLGLGAAAPKPEGKSSLKMSAIYHALTVKGHSVEKVAKDFAMPPKIVEQIYDKMAGVRLGAAAPIVQKQLPKEARAVALAAADKLITAGFDTPEKFAGVVQSFNPGFLPYLQSIWDIMAATGDVPRGTHDWNAILALPGPEKQKPEPVIAPQQKKDGGASLAHRVFQELQKSSAPGVLAFSNEELFRMAAIAYDGTIAEGKFTPKDAYDAMELGVNQYIAAHPGKWDPQDKSIESAKEAVANLKALIARLPTQRTRTEEQNEWQQFSTPPPFAFAVAWVANLNTNPLEDDVVLEPSAGIGGLAVFAQVAGAKVVGNELNDRRLALLKLLDLDRVTNENAEHINAILPKDIIPNVVLMNPPFSATAGRMEGKRATAVGAQHVVSALQRLQKGGRLVAIVGEGMAHGLPKFREWWQDIEKEYNVRADIGVSGKEYAKYGTTFGNRILVIDKTGPSTQPPLVDSVERVEDLFEKLNGIRSSRPLAEGQGPSIGKVGSSQQSGATNSPVSGASTGPKPATSPPTSTVGTGTRPRPKPAGGSSGPVASPGHTISGPAASEDTGTVARPGGRSAGATGRPGGSSERPIGEHPAPIAGVEQLKAESPADAEDTIGDSEDVFTEYKPKKIKFDGAPAHPSPLVESSSMNAVLPPDPVYQPRIPKELIMKGALSVEQFEGVLYTGQAQTEILESGERKGFFVGDGTGVGKGREIAAVFVDNRNNGRKRGVWISEKKGLIKAAQGDFSDMGYPDIEIQDLAKTKAKIGTIKLTDGILFSTYAGFIGDFKASRVPREFQPGAVVRFVSPTSDEPSGEFKVKKAVADRRHAYDVTYEHEGADVITKSSRLHSVTPAPSTKKSRLEQIVEWLGDDFDGPIVFDEAHNGQNAITTQTTRGSKQPSQTGLAVVELQARLPKARIMYASATGATEPYNLAYADRLGIWGPGRPFPNKLDFFSDISAAGLSAMEIVARDLKAMGVYMSRTLSMKGVDLDVIEHELTPEQISIYDNLAVQWQRVYTDMMSSLTETGADLNSNARRNARGQFFSSQQRFFNQLLTAMQTPTLMKNMKEDLDRGESVLVQITNTNEASQDRALRAAEDEERPLEELDLTPKDILRQYVARSFPIYLFEEYTDENGNVRSSMVMGSDGLPVEDPVQVAKRDALLNQIGDLPVPGNPLEQIIDAFGYRNVAEVTGRTTRVVTKDVDGKPKAVKETRNDSVRLVEAGEFNEGKRHILIFSDAGGTGFSYHSDKRFANQERRNHYVAQAGWRADKAVQGTGRSNRTNQANAPFVKLVRTNIEGHKRFISTVARRLSQLGAITTGERRASTRGLFSEDDNLEDSYAETALDRLMHASFGRTEPDLPWDTVVNKMGWDNLVGPGGELIEGNLPDVPQFLNRVLMLEFEEQNTVFNAFYSRRQRLIESAKEAGVYDPGLQTLHTPADGTNKIVKDEEVYRDPKIETPTRIVEIEQAFPAVFNTFEDAVKDSRDKKNPVWLQNRRSKQIYRMWDGTSTKTDHDSGRVYLPKVRVGIRNFSLVDPAKVDTRHGPQPVKVGQMFVLKQSWEDESRKYEVVSLPTKDNASSRLMVKMIQTLGKTEGPTEPEAKPKDFSAANNLAFGGQYQDLHELAKKGYYVEGLNDDADYLPKGGNYEEIDDGQAKALWNKELEEADPIERKKMHFVVGLMLPIWKRLQLGRTQVFRVKITDGDSFLGVKIPEKQVAGVRARLGAGTSKVSPDDVFHQVFDEGADFTLSNNWKIVRRKLSGDYRIEVTGPQWADRKNFEDYYGGFVEKVGGFQTRFFIPIDEKLGIEAISKIIEQNPVVEQGGAVSLGAAAPKFVRDLVEQDLGPTLKAMGLGVKEAFDTVRYGIIPTTNVPPATVDAMMKMLGERNQVNYVIRQTLESAKRAFDKMPRQAQIEFIDRYKQGEEQPNQTLTDIASVLAQIDADAYAALASVYRSLGYKEEDLPIKWLDNHFRVLWKVIPGEEGESSKTGMAAGKRPLRGSRGMLRQSTLATMSEGLERGGVPYSYNPIVMFEIAQADIWKLTTALKMWHWGKEHGLVKFVRGKFPKPPDGMTWLNDEISRVYFPAESKEGLIEPGRFAVETGFARLINNFLSKDVIRQMKLGRGLMWMKNFTTSLELALSLFHGVFETGEMVSSNIGLGLGKLYNRGILHKQGSAFFDGLMDVVKSVGTPVTGGTLGAQIRKAAGNPDDYFKTAAGKQLLSVYPNAKQLIDLLFAGGWKPGEVEADWKNQSIRAFTDAIADLKSGKSGNYIGAGLRAFPAVNEFMMGPLFDTYIPNLKVAQFFREMEEAMKLNDLKYPGGYHIDRLGKRTERPTNEELARKVWRLVEDRFGELNYDTLFWNNSFKSAMQLMFRSVTWKLGSVEAFAGAFAGQGKEFVDAFKERRAPELHRNMAWLFGIFLATAVLGTIIQAVFAKKKPQSLTDLVFPRIDPNDDKVRVSIPTYFKDLIHLVHSPTGYVKASLAGWIGRVADLLANKDYYGVQIRDTDDPATKQALAIGKYAAQSVLPFSVRGYKNLSSQQENTLRKSMALLGINPAPRYIGQTPAEKQVERFWQGQRTEEGTKPEQYEIQKGKRELVSKIRHGVSPDIPGALARGTIKPADIKGIYKRATMGQLASSIDRMPVAEAEKVYAKADATERAQLSGIMARKRSNSLKRSGRTLYTGF